MPYISDERILLGGAPVTLHNRMRRRGLKLVAVEVSSVVIVVASVGLTTFELQGFHRVQDSSRLPS